MAVGFSKPDFEYEYDLDTEKANFDKFFVDPVRGIPPKQSDELDLATWNIANLGVQKRRPRDVSSVAA